ncbi:MAG: radical SAM family heme chaperone HemW [Sphingomonadales bacterium]
MPASDPDATRAQPVPRSSADQGSQPGFGLYIHWPFCKSKCPYCDFNSHVQASLDEARWRRALLRELDHFAAQTRNRRVGSIYFGGGTPSLMAAETVTAILDRAARLWPLEDDVEITLEANPTSTEAARFEGYRHAGVNRLSLGIQALDDQALKFLGREHSAVEALAALALAGRHFERFTFDLIYARPGQSLNSWAAELGRALDLAGGHLSLYQLTVEPRTVFAARSRRGEVLAADPDLAATLYETTEEICRAAGLYRYEVSNYAARGQESRHNLNYWRHGEYVGIGPGAHGRLRLGAPGALHALNQLREPGAWLAAVEARGHGTERSEPLDRPTLATEMLLMALRLEEGLSRRRFQDAMGRPVEDFISADATATLAEEGLLESGPRAITVTARGMTVLDSILALLLDRGVN